MAKARIKKACPALKAGKWFMPLQLSANQCEKIKVSAGAKPIGCGNYACVYPKAGDPSRVIKVTRDKGDPAALLHVRGSGLTPKVFSAQELKVHTPLAADKKAVKKERAARLRENKNFKNPNWPIPDDVSKLGTQRVFMIELERVKPVTKEQEKFIHSAISYIENFLIYDRCSGRNKCKSVTLRLPGSELNSKAFCDSYFKGYKAKRCKKFVTKGVRVQQELIKRGILWEDRHSGNWGITRDGKLVAIDVGGSTVPLKKLKMLSGAPSKKR
jgi:hypothetical protein